MTVGRNVDVLGPSPFPITEHTLVFSPDAARQLPLQSSEQTKDFGSIGMPIIGNPTVNHRVDGCRQRFQRMLDTRMQPPTPNLGVHGFAADSWIEPEKQDGLPCSLSASC